MKWLKKYIRIFSESDFSITLGLIIAANTIPEAFGIPPVASLPWLSAGILILLSVVLNVIAAEKNPVEALRTE